MYFVVYKHINKVSFPRHNVDFLIHLHRDRYTEEATTKKNNQYVYKYSQSQKNSHPNIFLCSDTCVFVCCMRLSPFFSPPPSLAHSLFFLSSFIWCDFFCVSFYWIVSFSSFFSVSYEICWVRMCKININKKLIDFMLFCTCKREGECFVERWVYAIEENTSHDRKYTRNEPNERARVSEREMADATIQFVGNVGFSDGVTTFVNVNNNRPTNPRTYARTHRTHGINQFVDHCARFEM